MKAFSRIMNCVLLVGTAYAHADISYSEHVTVKAFGGMSMFASEGTVLTQISGDKARIDNNLKMNSIVAKAVAGNESSESIVRIDREVLWNLNPDKRQYTQQSFAELKARRVEALKAMQHTQDGSGGALPISAQGCQWSEGDLEFERPRGKEEVAGITTTKNIVRKQQSCEDRDTGNTCEISWTMENWMASEVPGEKEVRAFRTAWSQALGLSNSALAVEGPGAILIGMFASNWEAVAAELEQVKGYPLRTVMQMQIGGKECESSSGRSIVTDELWEGASSAAYNETLDETGGAAGSAIGDATDESLGGGIAGSIGGAAIGAATGQVIGGLTDMFKKTAEDPKEETPRAADTKVTVFTLTSEITDWSETAIPPERFEAPEDWKKL